MSYNNATHEPANARGGTSPVYQIDFTAVDSGKRIASTKRRIRWRFGFSNAEAMSAGETGTACRGEEHDITLIWSITSGKRLVLADGQEVHYSNNRSHLFDFSWTMRGNHVLKVVAHANPPANASAGFRQYDFYVDGMSFFNMPKVYRLGLVGGVRQQEPAGSLALATTTRGQSKSGGGYQNYSVTPTERPGVGDKKKSIIAEIEAPHNRDEEQAYLAEAIKNSLNEAPQGHSDNRSLPPPRQNDLLVDMMSEPGIPTTSMNPPRTFNGTKPVANVMFRQDAQVPRFEQPVNPNPSFPLSPNEQKMPSSMQLYPTPASPAPTPPPPYTTAVSVSPPPSYETKRNSFTAPPAPTQYAGAPAPPPPSYAGAPAPTQYAGAPSPTQFAGAPAPDPFTAAPAPNPFTAAPAPAPFTAAPAPASFTAAREPVTNDSKPAPPAPTPPAPTTIEETALTPPEPAESYPPPSLTTSTEPTGLGLDANAAFAKFASMDLIAKPSTAKDAKDRENPFDDVITKAPAPTLAGMKMMTAPTEKKEVMKPDPDSMSQPGALVLSGNQTGNWNAYPPSLGSQAPSYPSLGSQAPTYPQNSMTTQGYGQIGGQAGSAGMTHPMQSQGNGQPQQYYGLSGNQGGSNNYPLTMNAQTQQPQQQQPHPQYQQQPQQYGIQQSYVQHPQATQGYGYGTQQPR